MRRLGDRLAMAAVSVRHARLALARAAISERAAAAGVVALTTAASIGYWWFVALVRWQRFTTNAFDLGFFDQVVWNTAHGRLFATTFVPYNFVGEHLEPVLLAFAVPYRLGVGGPTFLLGAQAVLAAAAAVPLFAAARRFGLRPWLAAAVAVAYLANPYLHRALEFDFHPETAIALPCFLGLCAAAAGRLRWAAVAALSLLLFKEDAVFVALVLAGVIWSRGGRREAVVVGAVGLAYTAIGVGWLMPHMRAGIPSDLAERYGAVTGGHDGLRALAWAAMHPWVPVEHFVAHAGSAAAFVAASAPAAVLAPWTLVGMLPGLAVALLSSHGPQRGLEYQYGVELVPVALLGALLGARVVARRLGDGAAAAALLVPVAAGFLLLSPASPLTPGLGAAPSAAHRQAVRDALAVVPAGVPVAAQSGLVPRLSQRRVIREFPGHWRETDYVVVDQYGTRSSQSLAAGFDAALAEVRLAYDRVYAHDGVEVFRRPGARDGGGAP